MSGPKDDPVNWARDEAAKRSGYRAWDDVPTTHLAAINAHARTIETHERPPIDPDVLAVREILAAWHGELDEDYDNDDDFQAALAAYRRVKNGGAK